MREWETRAFFLRWQRDALARIKTCAPQAILSDADLNYAAKKLVFPTDALVPEEMMRLLAHFRHERMHDSEPDWIS